jgi:hypothetical protein
MSNMWRWANADSPQTFPQVPWALDMDVEIFPIRAKATANGFGKRFFHSSNLRSRRNS